MNNYERITKTEFFKKGGLANDGMARIKRGSTYMYCIIDKPRYLKYLNDMNYWGI